MHHQRMWTSSLAVIPQTLSLPPACVKWEEWWCKTLCPGWDTHTHGAIGWVLKQACQIASQTFPDSMNLQVAGHWVVNESLPDFQVAQEFAKRLKAVLEQVRDHPKGESGRDVVAAGRVLMETISPANALTITHPNRVEFECMFLCGCWL